MMTIIDAKKYLRQIKLLEKRINAKTEERQQIRDMLLRVTPVLRDTIVSSNASGHEKIENGIIKLEKYEEEINADIEKLIELKREFATIIDNIDDPDRVTVLYSRYIEYKSYEQIAAETKISLSNVYCIHRKALRDVSRILEEKNKN